MNRLLTTRMDLVASLMLAAALHLILLYWVSADRLTTTPPTLAQPLATRVALRLKARPPQPEPTPSQPQPVRVPRAQPDLTQPTPTLPRVAPPNAPRPTERKAPPPPTASLRPEIRPETIPADSVTPPEAFLAAAQLDVETYDGDIDLAPAPLRAIRPVYPYGARQRGEAGSVVAVILVSAQGRVEQVVIAQSSGFASLDRAAQEALQAARFVPARRGNAAVPARVRLTIIFQLKG